MNKTLGGVAAIAFLTAFGGVAAAQTAAPAGPQRQARASMAQPVTQADFVARRVERLRAADANQDGTVTAEEMRAAGQAKRAERRTAMFDRLDANKDGSISRAEFDAPRAQGQGGQRAEQRAGRGHRGGMHRGVARIGRSGEGRAPIVIAEAEQKATEAFTRLDANRDGTLTGEERRAGMEARRAEMRQKHQERRQAAPAAAPSPSTPASE